MDWDQQAVIFNIFHDGVITDLIKRSGILEMKIEIRYLAEMLDESYRCFYCKLINCDKFLLENWSDEQNYIHDLKTIIDYDLEIMDAKNSEEGVLVNCLSVEFIGGTLQIGTEDIKIFDQSKKEIFLDELTQLADRYWKDSV